MHFTLYRWRIYYGGEWHITATPVLLLFIASYLLFDSYSVPFVKYSDYYSMQCFLFEFDSFFSIHIIR